MKIYKTDFQTIELDQELGKGGEGVVYSIKNNPEVVAKIYHSLPQISLQNKIISMTQLKNKEILKKTSWPLEILKQDNQVHGFLMNKININEYRPIHLLYTSRSRIKNFPNASWNFLCHVCINLAKIIDEIHSMGHIIGDINENNILVNSQGLIKLIDCDSFQIKYNNQTYYCGVGVPLFTPPELQEKNLNGITRTVNHDYFGLAILIFYLLMMGRHPFTGKYSGPGESPPIEQTIKEFKYFFSIYNKYNHCEPPPPFDKIDIKKILPEEILNLFEISFSSTSVNHRTAAKSWQNALQTLTNSISYCSLNKNHSYFNKYSHCPWCEIESYNPGLKLFELAIIENVFNLSNIIDDFKKHSYLNLSTNIYHYQNINLLPDSALAKEYQEWFIFLNKNYLEFEKQKQKQIKIAKFEIDQLQKLINQKVKIFVEEFQLKYKSLILNNKLLPSPYFNFKSLFNYKILEKINKLFQNNLDSSESYTNNIQILWQHESWFENPMEDPIIKNFFDQLKLLTIQKIENKIKTMFLFSLFLFTIFILVLINNDYISPLVLVEVFILHAILFFLSKIILIKYQLRFINKLKTWLIDYLNKLSLLETKKKLEHFKKIENNLIDKQNVLSFTKPTMPQSIIQARQEYKENLNSYQELQISYKHLINKFKNKNHDYNIKFLNLQQEYKQAIEKSQKYKHQKLKEINDQLYCIQFQNYLNSTYLSQFKIPQIGEKLIETLTVYGIETALDVKENNLLGIPGLGPKKRLNLLEWKSKIENNFKFDPSQTIPKSEEIKIENEARLIKFTVEQKITLLSASNRNLFLETQKELDNLKSKSLELCKNISQTKANSFLELEDHFKQMQESIEDHVRQMQETIEESMNS